MYMSMERKIPHDFLAVEEGGWPTGEAAAFNDDPEKFFGRFEEPLPDDGYNELRRVLDEAVDQAASGKGKERHATEGEAFTEQQIVMLNLWLGSNHGDIFQAVKKSIESARLSPEAAKRELLGAINYLAAAVIVLEEQK